MLPRLVGFLVTILVAVANAQGTENFCGDRSLAQVCSNSAVELKDCGLDDSSISDIATCLDTVGRRLITRIDFSGNDLSSEMFSWRDDGNRPLLHGLEFLEVLDLHGNPLGFMPPAPFDNAPRLEQLNLRDTGLTSVPAGIFALLFNLQILDMRDNNDLQCLPSTPQSLLTGESLLAFYSPGHTPDGECFCDYQRLTACDWCEAGRSGYICSIFGTCPFECEPDNPNTCLQEDEYCCPDLGGICKPGLSQASACECDPNDDSSCRDDLVCCPEDLICKDPTTYADACGDPHMTGFHGQKFDFTGQDGEWYCLLSDLPSMHLNMRVTTPVPDRAEITYITGISVLTTDSAGLEHSIVITVKDPHSLESVCPTAEDGRAFPCLADGALSVVLDGQEGGLMSPGSAKLAPDVVVDAVNLPGACRSFGFEKYWERKKLEYAQAGRRLTKSTSMAEWILGDPTATNMDECSEYVARVVADGGGLGLLDHQSEHASFRIITPKATIRLTHGRLHQIATRDPTDRFDLPDHLTWQMNVAIDQNDVSLTAGGVLGETIVPRRDTAGNLIMEGMESIRGEKEEEYRVAGPLEVTFSEDIYHQP